MLVYLHGFNSGGTSGKATWLRDNLPDIAVLSPTYPVHRADAAPDFLRAYVLRARRGRPGDKRLLLVGSSLGGFWARGLARELNAGMALINPGIHPDVDLRAAIGPNTNEATGERYVLTAEQVRVFARRKQPHCDPGVPTLVLLDEGDELLDHRVAQAYYRGCGKILVYPGGSHRFEHLPEALPEIRRLHDACPE